MINPDNILASKKKIGNREQIIIEVVSEYFEKENYRVLPHSRFNIAWGAITSDLDILLVKHNTISYVEVKSKTDKINNAIFQIEKVKDIIDYGWIATDKEKINIYPPNIGIINIKNGAVNVIKEPVRYNSKPSFETMLSLKKKCLMNFLTEDEKGRNFRFKYDIATYIFEYKESLCTRYILKHIVTCDDNCIVCPVIPFVQ